MQLSLATLSLATAESLQCDGMDSVESSNAWLIEMLRERGKQISDLRGMVCSDDVRVWAESLGYQPQSPNLWGCLFRGKGWAVVGRKKSELVANHGRFINVYRWEAGT